VGLYQKICYSVEDLFVKLLTRKQDKQEVLEKVNKYRNEKEIKRKLKKEKI
jgi:predicted CopG family antitoxin